ncbi:hypothetical protein NC99_45020 [Sunxiuqinia dokdonensis]|uniref:Uncharacterized protein n=1 Tax=Sunxiuqinia dokdonensis TaxID=1409788 RepID=A0A0L8V2M2_9BACT|nr:hypothetical protein NC99_45020 [Sunxiuqinia dokdonensis]
MSHHEEKIKIIWQSWKNEFILQTKRSVYETHERTYFKGGFFIVYAEKL